MTEIDNKPASQDTKMAASILNVKTQINTILKEIKDLKRQVINLEILVSKLNNEQQKIITKQFSNSRFTIRDLDD